MYEDSWYSFVPELQTRKTDTASHGPGHRRRESLLKQPNDGGNAIENRPDLLQEVYEISPLSKGPPEATVIRRASSYSDFYRVARAQITKDVKRARAENCKEWTALAAAPAKSSLDFESLYDEHEDELLDASQEEYQLYMEQLSLSERHLDSLLVDTTSALDLLATLSESFKSVEAQTSAFQAQCEGLLDEQKRLKSLADEVGEDLQYYSYLEPITRRLNAPGSGRLVRGEGIVEILETLDNCIGFMAKHLQHREAEAYLSRYNSLLQRSLSLIQLQFSDDMDKLAKDTMSKMVLAETDTMRHAYAYGSWESIAVEFEDLLRCLSTKTVQAYQILQVSGNNASLANPNSMLPQYQKEQAEAFRELINKFIRAREGFVIQEVAKSLEQLDTREGGDIQAASRAIDKVFETCRMENDLLMHVFFPYVGEYAEIGSMKVLWEYETNYATFLGKIVNQIKSKLVLFMGRQELDQAVELELWFLRKHVNPESAGDELVTSDRMPGQFVKNVSVQFLSILDPEVSVRFYTIINQKIRNYNHAPEDLKLEAGPIDETATTTDPASSNVLDATNDLGDAQAQVAALLGPAFKTAYPTVHTAVKLLVLHRELLLAKEHQDGDDELSYEILHHTTESLQRAATAIKKNGNIINAHVFLIKNLLFMKNLLVNYEMSASHKASHLEFVHIWTTFVDLRSRGKLFDPRAYYSLLGSGQLFPRVVENDLDARLELDGVLRQQITKFTELFAEKIVKRASERDTMRKILGDAFAHDKKVSEALEAAVDELIAEKKR